jgi:hypothetical protein
LKLDGKTIIGSTDELVEWLFADQERLTKYDERDVGWFASRLGIPANILRAILYSHSFKMAMHDEAHFREISPSKLSKYYRVFESQLLDPEVPLGAKRSALELFFRQAGFEKPRKLSVKQQSEIVVRLEQAEPVQVLEVLGVPVDEISDVGDARALPGGGTVGGVRFEDATTDSDSPDYVTGERPEGTKQGTP